MTYMPQVRVSPVPIVEAECLPEGRKFVIVDIDWTQVPIQSLNGTAPYIDLPEVVINDNSGDGPGKDNSLGGYQQIEFTLDQITNGPILSQCVACMFHNRPQYGTPAFLTGVSADFSYNGDEICATYVTSVDIGQTFNIPAAGIMQNAGELCWLIDGAVPFYVTKTGTIRIVRILEVEDVPATVASGRLTLIFSNFPVPPFLNCIVATNDGP
jgi:hypothetical protein